MVMDLGAAQVRSREPFVDAIHLNLRGEELQARLILPQVAAAVAGRRSRRAPPRPRRSPPWGHTMDKPA